MIPSAVAEIDTKSGRVARYLSVPISLFCTVLWGADIWGEMRDVDSGFTPTLSNYMIDILIWEEQKAPTKQIKSIHPSIYPTWSPVPSGALEYSYLSIYLARVLLPVHWAELLVIKRFVHAYIWNILVAQYHRVPLSEVQVALLYGTRCTHVCRKFGSTKKSKKNFVFHFSFLVIFHFWLFFFFIFMMRFIFMMGWLMISFFYAIL